MNLDELYFKDNFTQDGDLVNLEVNQITASCITSSNNKFSLDNNGNLSVNSIQSVIPISGGVNFEDIYPVGSIYMNINSTNPGTLFGGTWEQIQDRFLLACGSTYSNGTTGGEASHVLTETEMPSHYHSAVLGAFVTYGYSTANCNLSSGGNCIIGAHGGSNTTNAGSSQAHNNMPPYLAVYIWKRIS